MQRVLALVPLLGEIQLITILVLIEPALLTPSKLLLFSLRTCWWNNGFQSGFSGIRVQIHQGIQQKLGLLAMYRKPSQENFYMLLCLHSTYLVV